jgi:hypothetical protein
MQSEVEIQFELDEAKDLNALENNIKYILKGYANKKMATHQVIRYLNEKKIAREWLASKKINSKDELEKYLNNLQNKVRSGVKSNKKEESKKAKQDLILSEIERLANEQEYEMQKRIKEKYNTGGTINNEFNYTVGGL